MKDQLIASVIHERRGEVQGAVTTLVAYDREGMPNQHRVLRSPLLPTLMERPAEVEQPRRLQIGLGGEAAVIVPPIITF